MNWSLVPVFVLVAWSLAVGQLPFESTGGIVLWLFGGGAQLEGDTPDARAELRVEAAGPALSLALAAGAGGIGAFSGGPPPRS